MKIISISLLVLFLYSFAHAEDKSYAGVWTTTYGRMRLIETSKDKISGIYSFGGDSTIEGKIVGKKFTFKYKEKNADGNGWFELNDDGSKFSGEWKENGKVDWEKWTGDRLIPFKGREWHLRQRFQMSQARLEISKFYFKQSLITHMS